MLGDVQDRAVGRDRVEVEGALQLDDPGLGAKAAVEDRKSAHDRLDGVSGAILDQDDGRAVG